ncbi:MAG TPA: DUF6691 family protein [Flavisolibacter sp.]|nr:DUF6691 family protein [Flavisolibacter sp.]
MNTITEKIKSDTNTDFEVRSLDTSKSDDQMSTKNSPPFIYLFLGFLFGVLLVKSEVVSWFRIQEMFRFQSFHMYGVIGSAVVTGIISIQLIKKFKVKTIKGEVIYLPKKEFHKGVIYGGLLFGFGWALTGACPGPLFAQIGAGATVVIITLLSAIGGTWVYGFLKERLPH